MFVQAVERIEKITGIRFQYLNQIFDGEVEQPYLQPPRDRFYDILPFLKAQFAHADGSRSTIHLLITEDDRLFAGRSNTTPIQVGVVPPNSFLLVQEIYDQVAARYAEHSEADEILLLAFERCIEPQQNLELMRDCRANDTLEVKKVVQNVLSKIQRELTKRAFN